MAYNKAKAEQEWLRWKEAEEQQLEAPGVLRFRVSEIKAKPQKQKAQRQAQ